MSTRLALCDVRGPLTDLLEKLSGDNGEQWFHGLNRFLRKENPWGVKEFHIWRTLTIGGVSKDELTTRLGNGFFVSEWAKDIMSKPEFVTAPEPYEIQLARVKVKDFGFKEMPTTTELFTRIKEVGGLCPAEVGPHLRLADKDQLEGERYWIAMKPITDSDGNPNVFRVDRGGGGEPWLSADCASPGSYWNLENRVCLLSSQVADLGHWPLALVSLAFVLPRARMCAGF